jgi:hypothetical protein
MRLRTAPALSSLLFSGVLVGGCGNADDTPARADREPTVATASVSPPGDGASPTCDAGCRSERRAERNAREAERCDSLLSRVHLSYRITATPTAGGSTIGLWMTLANRSTVRLGGSTGGLLKVDPDPRSNRISWGGSSADELWQKPGSTTRREVWHDRQPPGWHPVGDRVTSFDFNAYVYAPGPGTVVCHIPATVRAPPQLVEGHPSGRWRQESSS